MNALFIYNASNMPHPWQKAGSPVCVLAENEEVAASIAECIPSIEGVPSIWLSNWNDNSAYEYQVNVWYLDGSKLLNVRWFDYQRVNPLTAPVEEIKRAYQNSNPVWDSVPDQWYLDAEKRLA